MEFEIQFDSEHKLRVFDPEKLQKSVEIRDSSEEFIEKIERFKKLIQDVMQVIQAQGEAIEKEKLLAIGTRNKVKAEKELRERKVRSMEHLAREKNIELERFQSELESLKKVYREQKKLLERMSDNTVGDDM